MAKMITLTDEVLRWGDAMNYLEIWKDGDAVHFSRVEEIQEDPGATHVVAHLDFEYWELDRMENLVGLLEVPYVQACEFLEIDKDPFELLRQVLGENR